MELHCNGLDSSVGTGLSSEPQTGHIGSHCLILSCVVERGPGVATVPATTPRCPACWSPCNVQSHTLTAQRLPRQPSERPLLFRSTRVSGQCHPARLHTQIPLRAKDNQE